MKKETFNTSVKLFVDDETAPFLNWSFGNIPFLAFCNGDWVQVDGGTLNAESNATLDAHTVSQVRLVLSPCL